MDSPRGERVNKRLKYAVIIEAGATLLLVWAILCLLSAHALGSTPISGPHELLTDIHDDGPEHVAHRILLAVVMSLSAALAYIGLRRGDWRWVFPQQAVLSIAAISSLVAVLNGHYADGTVRPWEFIASGEALMIIFAVFHFRAWVR